MVRISSSLAFKLRRAFWRELDRIAARRFSGFRCRLLHLGAFTALLGGIAQIGVALLGLDIDVVEDRHGNDGIAAFPS